MRYLYFDTETTGKFVFGRPPTAEGQPHLAQLAAILEEDGREVGIVNLYVQPSIRMPDDTAAFHGITNEVLARYAVSPSNAAYIFRDLAASADVIVAHNIQFDRSIMIKALHDLDIPEIPWKDIKQHCTMLTATPICNIRTAKGPKWPKLEECVKIFFDETLEGAHDALVDVRACARVHKHLLSLNAFKE